MPLEVVVELQIRAISCPGVFLPDKQDVYLGVYLLNQYLETDCFPSVFPVMIQQSMRFEKGIAPKIEFSTRTAIRERVFLQRNRFSEEKYNKSRRPLSATDGPKLPINNMKTKPKESNLNRLPQSMQSRAPSPVSARRCFHDQPAQLNLGNNVRISGGSKPPFVVRHVDSAKPFGENISEYQSRKSRRKLKFSNLPFPGRRASSLDSLAANVKVIKEPDERIVLRKESPSPLDSSKFGKPSPIYSNQGDADFYGEASFAASQHSRSPSPLLDQPLFCDKRFHPCSQSSWRKIHERACSLLTSHRDQQHLRKEYSISEAKYIFERPSYLLKEYPVHEQRYF
ncbi:PREDICTED: spermatogenesis associated 6-like protein [Odobenus rosmarus divergens]|uniref:Spermatogenesis associated 6-like protein n=1 Tax=Odobenus rosmarus divergens TaxID=9708 RepID=A0A2U3WH63_ODORO|nr:PREDICTED: spermatogenesis associated 6-like protein [Odobenus rosmarus divergens]